MRNEPAPGPLTPALVPTGVPPKSEISWVGRAPRGPRTMTMERTLWGPKLGHRHPHGHDHVQVVLLAWRSEEARAQGAVEKKLHLVLPNDPQGIQDVAGIECDLDFRTLDGGGHLRLAIPDLIGGGGQDQRPRLGLDPDHVGAVAGEERHRTDRLGELTG